ncbi:putative Divergent CRAL/TRIO domain containing protein [Blattamonas nauphoetae]|uniref:Divergent CRAL/TRIO domain containing protein n=1 Tax=Blattamonas nauphoetae TaxID=2049346 RepID=A0ABQ9XLS8_9EUKA|nr:putative Divergent CRAL/TRIO domain containing protein [Blattamonas nauphoetae]
MMFLPSYLQKNVKFEVILPYILNKLDPIKFGPFTLIINCTNTIYSGDPPSFVSPKLYNILPYQIKKNVQRLIIVNPPTFARVILAIIRTIASFKFMKKVHLLDSMTDLYKFIDPEQLQIPCIYLRWTFKVPHPAFYGITFPQLRSLEYRIVLNCVCPAFATQNKSPPALADNSPFHPTRLFPVLDQEYIPLTFLNLASCLLRGIKNPDITILTPDADPIGQIPLRNESCFIVPPNPKSLEVSLAHLQKDPLLVFPEDVDPSLLFNLLIIFLKQIPSGLLPPDWATGLTEIWEAAARPTEGESIHQALNVGEEGHHDQKQGRQIASLNHILPSLSAHLLLLPTDHLGTVQLVFSLFSLAAGPLQHDTHVTPDSLVSILGPALFGGDQHLSSILNSALVLYITHWDQICTHARSIAGEVLFPQAFPLPSVPVVFAMIKNRLQTISIRYSQSQSQHPTPVSDEPAPAQVEHVGSALPYPLVENTPHLYCFALNEVEVFLARPLPYFRARMTTIFFHERKAEWLAEKMRRSEERLAREAHETRPGDEDEALQPPQQITD